MTGVPVRVATFNIRHGLGLDGVIDLDRTAAAVSATGADLIALQEVDRSLRRSALVDQASALAERTGLAAHFTATLRRGDGEYGLALLTRDPAEVAFEALPRLADEEPRGMLVARWRGLTLIATHLARHRAPRRVQTEALAERAASLPPPSVVLGDLNQGRRGLARLVSAGFEPGPHRATFAGGRQIDHILTGPGVRFARIWTLETDASDHLPLIADLEAAAPPR